MMLCGVEAIASAQLLKRKALAIRPGSGKGQSPHNGSRPGPGKERRRLWGVGGRVESGVWWMALMPE